MIKPNLRLKKHTRLIFKSIILLIIFAGCILDLIHSNQYFQLYTLRNTSILAGHSNKNNGDDDDIVFNVSLKSIKEAKLIDDNDHDLWWLNNTIKMPVNVPFPIKKPIIYPHDPRFTVNSYLNYIHQQLNTGKSVVTAPFHWSDWVNLDLLHKHIFNTETNFDYCTVIFNISKNGLSKGSTLESTSEYCQLSKRTPLGFEISKPPSFQTIENLKELGRAYLYTQAPPPSKLVFLTNSNIDVSYQVQVTNSENDLKYSLLHNEINSKNNVRKYTTNILSTYNSLVRQNPPQKLDNQRYWDEAPILFYNSKTDLVNLTESSFDVDIDFVLKNQPQELTPIEHNYYNSIKYSVSEPDPPKYFAEAKIIQTDPRHLFGDHYDWRFFSGLKVGTEEDVSILHRLIKNYLAFARQNNIRTWIAHGSLLSWYWSGSSFPWDLDIDVQVPIADLHYMAKHFNQSLIVESVADNDGEFDGLGRYFLDIGSFITHRESGNGNNNIDARFIDIDTGAFIDITALAISNTQAPRRYIKQEEAANNTDLLSYDPNRTNLDINRRLKVYNCRNNHFMKFEALSPLVPTLVENQIGYVPNDFTSPLLDEYRLNSITIPSYHGHWFIMELRLWIPDRVILQYLVNPTDWVKQRNVIISQNDSILHNPNYKLRITTRDIGFMLNLFSATDYINLLYDPIIFKQFFTNFKLSKYHVEELKRLLKSEYSENGKQLNAYTNKPSNKAGSGMKPDGFMNELILSREEDFNSKIDKLIELFET